MLAHVVSQASMAKCVVAGKPDLALRMGVIEWIFNISVSIVISKGVEEEPAQGADCDSVFIKGEHDATSGTWWLQVIVKYCC